ncbi:hypothetical protein [Streptomyces sp. SID3343]|uniref:hypothetical protein n=1 Tax=Streptomyces sp. SID3343 TaxID=2690260 RepID=UPI00136E1C0D|nr:hypothetical protein [Streptomyces sp. SID3343]MYV97977.1 hypothetical protein [Streptomyces sp. SID3343]
MTARIDGAEATWFLDEDAIVIRYSRGRRVPQLFDVPGEVSVPHTVSARVTA